MNFSAASADDPWRILDQAPRRGDVMADDLFGKGPATLDQLDVLHDEVLARLDDLNSRLEATLAQFGIVRRAPPVPPGGERAAS